MPNQPCPDHQANDQTGERDSDRPRQALLAVDRHRRDRNDEQPSPLRDVRPISAALPEQPEHEDTARGQPYDDDDPGPERVHTVSLHHG